MKKQLIIASSLMLTSILSGCQIHNRNSVYYQRNVRRNISKVAREHSQLEQQQMKFSQIERSFGVVKTIAANPKNIVVTTGPVNVTIQSIDLIKISPNTKNQQLNLVSLLKLTEMKRTVLVAVLDMSAENISGRTVHLKPIVKSAQFTCSPASNNVLCDALPLTLSPLEHKSNLLTLIPLPTNSHHEIDNLTLKFANTPATWKPLTIRLPKIEQEKSPTN